MDGTTPAGSVVQLFGLNDRARNGMELFSRYNAWDSISGRPFMSCLASIRTKTSCHVHAALQRLHGTCNRAGHVVASSVLPTDPADWRLCYSCCLLEPRDISCGRSGEQGAQVPVEVQGECRAYLGGSLRQNSLHIRIWDEGGPLHTR